MATLLIWEDDAGQTVSVRFDVVSTETHELLNAITEHSVEEGSNVSDHVRPELDRIMLEGYVTNKPLFRNPGVEDFMDFTVLELDIPEKEAELPITPGALTRTITGAIGSLFDSPQRSATLLNTSEFKNRVRDMYDSLRDARDNARVMRVQGRLHEYDSMVVERVSVPRTVQDGNGATFQVDLKQLRFVKSETVDAPDPAELRGQLPVSVGSKNAGPDANDEKKSEKAKSIAAQLFDGGGSALSNLMSFP